MHATLLLGAMCLTMSHLVPFYGTLSPKLQLNLGAAAFLDFKTDNIEEEVHRLTNGYGAHGVVVSVGSTAAYTEGFKLLRRLGTLVCVGIPRTDFDLPISPFMMIVRSIKVVGSSCGAYIARAIAQKYSEQVDGLLLRVPLVEPDNKNRDLDPFKPLVSDNQVMDNRSAEEKAALGDDVLIQTPAYVQALMRKYETMYTPAIEQADNDVLVPIREDPSGYVLSTSVLDEHAKFFAPALIWRAILNLSCASKKSHGA